MSAFDSIFASRTAPTLIAMFADSIVYVPKIGEPRTISALIDYMPPETIGNTGHVVARTWKVTVMDDPVTGIDSTTINFRDDRIQLEPWPGKTPVSISIHQRERQESGGGGLLTLECG